MYIKTILILLLLVPTRSAFGQDALCANRLAISISGEVARGGQTVDSLLAGDAFIENFSRYINSQFNDEPGETAADDAPYYLTEYVLKNDLPWNQLFSGPYMVVATGRNDRDAVVREDPEGLGYFRSPAWKLRYAGNEGKGVLLSMAYRILQNTVGLVVQAADLPPDADGSAQGRRAAGCRSCHFDSWFALDHTASVLGTVKEERNGDRTFAPPSGDPMKVLGNQEASNDKELVEILTNSEHYRFNTCSLLFRYLYGRNVIGQEGLVFDKCMKTFAAEGRVRPALKVMAEDPTYCK